MAHSIKKNINLLNKVLRRAWQPTPVFLLGECAGIKKPGGLLLHI